MTPHDRQAFSVHSERAPFKPIVFPLIAQRYSPAEKIAWALGNLGGLIDGEFVLAHRVGDSAPRDFSGAISLADYVDGTGRRGRPPDPDRILRELRDDPVGDVFWGTPEGIAVAFIFPDVENDTARLVSTREAADRILGDFIHRHALSPLEYAPSKFRGGYLVDRSTDFTRPTWLPRSIVNGQRRDAAIYLAPGDLLSAERLIARAGRIAPPPPVSFPTVREERGGVLKTVANFLRIGGEG